MWSRNFALITAANLFTFLGFQMLMPVMPVYATALGGGQTWAGFLQNDDLHTPFLSQLRLPPNAITDVSCSVPATMLYRDRVYTA